MGDHIDERILQELRNNSKIPITALSKIVGRSRTAVQARIRRLEDSGDIQRYTIAEAGGYESPEIGAIVLINVAVRNQSDELIKAFKKLPYVQSCHAIVGEPAFAIMIKRTNPSELPKIVESLYNLKGVTKTETIISLKTIFQII